MSIKDALKPNLATHRIQLSAHEHIDIDWHSGTKSEDDLAIFIHGLASDRHGDKCQAFAREFCSRGWQFIAPDLRGHGSSSGGLEDLRLSNSLADLMAIFNWLPFKPRRTVLIGSSMGAAVIAWHHCLVAENITALVYIAPSFDFPHSVYNRLSSKDLAAWRSSGIYKLPSDWIDINLAYGLVEDAQPYTLAKLFSLYKAPSLIFHGTDDDAVPWQLSENFRNNLLERNVLLQIINGGDHRLNQWRKYLATSTLAWLDVLLNEDC